jgi:hypothetical protein
MMNLTSWKPPEPGGLEPRRGPPRRAASTPPTGLDAALSERGTVIVLVVGAGPESDRAERRCRGLAQDPGFEAVRVVRVRDQAELSAPQRACWLAGGRPLTILGPDRLMALPLEKADAVDLFVAVAALA